MKGRVVKEIKVSPWPMTDHKRKLIEHGKKQREIQEKKDKDPDWRPNCKLQDSDVRRLREDYWAKKYKTIQALGDAYGITKDYALQIARNKARNDI